MKNIICHKCKVPLEMAKCKFRYLSLDIASEVPRCPKCGMTYLSEDLVKDRIHQVEANLEDK